MIAEMAWKFDISYDLYIGLIDPVPCKIHSFVTKDLNLKLELNAYVLRHINVYRVVFVESVYIHSHFLKVQKFRRFLFKGKFDSFYL